MTVPQSACAVAHTNIALIKYWGKLKMPGNFPAVPSLSLTLDRLFTRTHVTFDPMLTQDEFELDGRNVAGQARQRVVCLLDAVRIRASSDLRARVRSVNNFPTASGLASSASGFAALALAAATAAGLELNLQQASALARESSASAARSLFGGWVTLEVEAPAAKRLSVNPDWDLVLIIAVTDKRPKSVGSTEGMNLCSSTSPVYESWLRQSPLLFERARHALEHDDFTALGQAMEASTLLMHATMMTANPALIYLAPVSLFILKQTREWRAAGVPIFFTTDAGPHVKLLTTRQYAEQVSQWLNETPGVDDVLVCSPGPDAAVESTSAVGGVTC